jgi:hypothetical protein
VLHLLPIRLLLTGFALLVMAAYAFSLRAGFVTAGTTIEVVLGILKVATPLVAGTMIASLALWRWTPPFIQNLVFPYLGGSWEGVIEFSQDGAPVTRPATLEVVQTLTSIKFALRTAESTSETTLVHARKAPVEKDLVKLVYIYQVERLEGVPGAGDRYRGCAFLDVDLNDSRAMTGSYMAGAGRAGTIRMQLRRKTAWWKLWR